MAVSSRYVLQQGPMLATLGKTAARALVQSLRPAHGAGRPVVPSPELRRTFPAPSPALLDAYIRHVGGDPRAYRGIVPPHFFPQWSIPVAAQTLVGLPYPLLSVVNAGCRMQINAPLPRGERLHVRAQLTAIDDDGRRALLTQRVVTGTDSTPDALVSEIHAFVPLRRANNGHARSAASGEKPHEAASAKERPRVPMGAHEIGFEHLPKDTGLAFAKLTGDFNPIHWLAPYAKAAGFRSVILHGFGTFARACEALNRSVLGGDVRKLKALEAKFTRPLLLPHDVGYYVLGDALFVGDAVLGPAYMAGRFDAGDLA
jgi:acyl dehydratase